MARKRVKEKLTPIVKKFKNSNQMQRMDLALGPNSNKQILF